MSSSEVLTYTNRLDFLAKGACNDADPEVMFPHDADEAGIEAAKRVCRGCKVRLRCREAFLHEKEGIFGGTDKDERRNILRRRARHERQAEQSQAELPLQLTG